MVQISFALVLLLIDFTRCMRNSTLHVLLYDNYIYQRTNDANQTVLEKTFTYAKKLQCNDLPDLKIHAPLKDHQEIHQLVAADDPLEILEREYGIKNTTNILVGTVSPNGNILEVVQKFVPYDKLFKSDGVVVIVHKSQLSLPRIILRSVADSGDFFVAMVMLAIPAGLLLWLLDRWGQSPTFCKRFVSGTYDTIWWAFVTMTTVGYGDKVPVTIQGRLLGVVWMVVSIVFTACMTSIITGHMSDYSITLSDRSIAALSNSWEEMVAQKTTTKTVHECFNYTHCLDLVVKRTAYSTLIDANQAASMQEEINEKNLRITSMIQKQFTSFLYFYKSEENEKEVQYVMNCLNNLTIESREMIHNLYIPVIHYTTSEVEGPLEFFKEPPYIGFIIVGIIGGLCLIGCIIDVIEWNRGKKINKKESHVTSNGNAIAMKNFGESKKMTMKKKIQNLKQELLDDIKDMEHELIDSLNKIQA